MNKEQALEKMVFPSMKRPNVKPYNGVIQIHVTRLCDKYCNNCTQGSNLKGIIDYITLDNFEKACESLVNYFGVVGMFGGNPAVHPYFKKLCDIFCDYIPYNRRGIWCNNPLTEENARIMSRTFNPSVSNLNVHLDEKAYKLFKKYWPNSNPFGLEHDSRHAPVFVAMKDVLKEECLDCGGTGRHLALDTDLVCDNCGGSGEIYDIEKAWELISKCDINQNWSAMCGQFRGELRGWFCEIAGAQSIINQEDPNYPDTGIDILKVNDWWMLGKESYSHQIEKHCHDCGVPLKGYGELATKKDGIEQCSKTYESVYKLKGKDKILDVVEDTVQLGMGRIQKFTKYLQNSTK